MEKAIEITDPVTFKRRHIKNLKTVDHTLTDENGEAQCVPCVEFTVIGRNHEWPFWAILTEFKKVNPDIEI